MKILCLADLHRYHKTMILQDQWLAGLMQTHKPDVVLIVGDVFQSSLICNPYEELHRLFGDVKVICTLGNHEFYHYTTNKILELYKDLYSPDEYDVHYLDIIDFYDVDDVHFYGNVLWYDGSMSTVPNQNLNNFANGTWNDKLIKNLDWKTECEKSIKKIKEHSNSNGKIKILCTHCAPHSDLNAHVYKIVSSYNPYNAYSGVSWLLDDLHKDGIAPNYVFCGHTHRRVAGIEIHGCKCVNIGNNYRPPFQHFLLEL